MRFFLLLSLTVTSLLPACRPDPPESKLNEYALCCLYGPVLADLGGGKVYIPNIITVNDDGNNEIFYPFASPGILKIENFEIRSPGGTLLYARDSIRLNEPADGWNGKVSFFEPYKGQFAYSMRVWDETGYAEIIQGSACAFLCDEPEKIPDLENCFFPNQNNGMGGLDTLLSSGETDCF